MTRLCALAIVFVSFTLGLQNAPAERVKVFVTTTAAPNGFSDPNKGDRDTVSDLQNAIKDEKSIQLTERSEDAMIILTVLGRETANVTAGFLGNPARDREIHVKFTCGEFTTEMSASAKGGTLGSGGAWGKAAKKIAKQVNDWVNENRAKLTR